MSTQEESHVVADCDLQLVVACGCVLRQSKQGSSHQKKVQFNQSAKKVVTNDSIGTFSPGLYILYFLKLPAPPRAALGDLIEWLPFCVRKNFAGNASPRQLRHDFRWASGRNFCDGTRRTSCQTNSTNPFFPLLLNKNKRKKNNGEKTSQHGMWRKYAREIVWLLDSVG